MRRLLATGCTLLSLLAAASAGASDPFWQEIDQQGDVPEPIWEASVSYARQAGGPDVVFRFGGQRGDFPTDFVQDDFYALELDTGTWIDLSSGLGALGAPGPRAEAMMIPGPCGQCVSVAGGRGRFRSGSDLMFPDLWTFHLPSGLWREVRGARLGDRQAIRRSTAVVLAVPDVGHPTRELVYAFGGIGNTLPRFPTTPTGLLNDLVRFDQRTGWAPVPTSGEPPVPRAWSTGAYDPNGHRLLIFGGYRLGEDQGPDTPGNELFGPTNFENDLWSLDLATLTWTELEPEDPLPSPRDNVPAFFDAGRGGLVIFGGQGFDGLRSDLWFYSVTEDRWIEIALAPDSPVPPGRVGGVWWVRETPESYELWLHGGSTSDGGPGMLLGDLWRLTWPKA